MNESKDLAKAPDEPKPTKATEKQAPKPAESKKPDLYTVECDHLQTRGGKIRRGQTVSASALGDAAVEALVKAGRIKKA